MDGVPSQRSFVTGQSTGWPPRIAELMGTNKSFFNTVLTDWGRGFVYVIIDYGGYAKYQVELATQTAPLAVGTDPYNSNVNAAALDPVTGNLFISRSGGNDGPNSCSVVKVEPGGFNITGIFGNHPAIFWNYPDTILPADDMAIAVCNGVSYVLVKESVFSGNVAGIYANTMQQAGFYQSVVVGSTDNRGMLCAGKIGSTSTTYATYDSVSIVPSSPIWVITISAGAESWNPAVGPASNPYFGVSEIGVVYANQIDPTWTQLVMESIGYDNADDNLILQVRNLTDSGIAVDDYLLKVSSVDASIMWTLPISGAVTVDLKHCRINGSLWVFENSSYNTVRSWQINTLNGQAEQQQISNIAINTPCYIENDSVSNLSVVFASYYNVPPYSPTPVDGTPNSFQDYAILGAGVPKMAASYVIVPPASYLEFLTCCDRGIMAHLYQITTPTGISDYFTDFDIDITYNGILWKSGGLRFEGLARKVSVGVAVDEQTLKVWASPTDTIFGSGLFLPGVEEGILDGAVITRWRIVWQFVTGNAAIDIQQPPLYAWKLFTGYMGSVTKGGASHVEFKVRSALVRLNLNMPRNYYQPGCLWTLYDQGCTLPKQLYRRDSTVAAATLKTISPAGGIDPPIGLDNIAFYAQGRLLFNSGPNAGLQLLIDNNDTVSFYMAYPMNTVPNIGDSITFYPGCSKSFNTCQVKFNNVINFRGFDKVPPVMVSV